MCGRFTNRLTWDEIVRLYRLTMKAPPHNVPPRYNICPTDPVDAVTGREGSRDFVRMRWGLVPSWWPKPLKELKAATFNARVETVAKKPFFRDAFMRTRCLIPASGYYEWQDTATGKQPWYFTRADGEPMTFAGLRDEWKDKATGEVLKSCTMLITSRTILLPKCTTACRWSLNPKISCLGSTKADQHCSNPQRTKCCNAGRCRGASIARERPPMIQA
jgi:putative SOS response-associated peptidase YedK